MRSKFFSLLAWFLVVTLWVTISPGSVARADEDYIDDDVAGFSLAQQQDARDFAVSMVDSQFTASAEAARAALTGGEEAFSEYLNGGMHAAQLQDFHSILVTVAAIGGEHVQQRVGELLDSGDVAEIGTFLNEEWEHLQFLDNRKTAWDAAARDEDSAVKRNADIALRDGSPEALAEFANHGLEASEGVDRRRQVYELADSELPSVASGARDALMAGTDEAVQDFLRYGQFVAAAQDQELLSTKQLVDVAIDQAKRAEQAQSMAVQLAERAALAMQRAREATVRARDEAHAAGEQQVRAGIAARSAGELALQSAQVADQAVAAAQEARVALQQTIDAVSRAAAAAAAARQAAAVASARASSAARNAGDAAAARQAAEQARDAAAAAHRASVAYQHAARAAGFARSSSASAAAAAADADGAAAAASAAASAAGASEEAAAQARAGAQRARAAANRARKAAQRLDAIVGRIEALVQEADDAARSAADHAQRSADAAEEAARHADNAESFAELSGQYAAESKEAAEAAGEAVRVAERAVELARELADQRLEDEREFVLEQARDEKAIQDVVDRIRKKREDNQQAVDAIVADYDGNREIFADNEESLREFVVSAAQSSNAIISGAAKVALADGSSEALEVFADQGFAEAQRLDYERVVVEAFAYDEDERVRVAAEEFLEADDDELEVFVEETLPELRKHRLRVATWQVRESAGDVTLQAADDALLADSVEKYEEFLHEGYSKARWEDQIRQAYELVDVEDKETALAAQAAVMGDRQRLDEFYRIGQFSALSRDHQRYAHDATIDGLLASGHKAWQYAEEVAASALEAHEQALGDSQRAREYADLAADYAGQAQESANRANEHANTARQALDVAKAQRERAWQAAAAADRDASAAEGQARQATGLAFEARTAANQAQRSAQSARVSAVAASNDAGRAAQAAQDAYAIAHTKWLEEIRLARELELTGAIEETIEQPGMSLWDAIKEFAGEHAIQLLKDLIGITDVENCLRGSAGSCLWLVAEFAVGKLLTTGIKAIKHRKRFKALFEAIPKIRAAMRPKFVTRVSKRSRAIDAAMARCLPNVAPVAHQQRSPQAVDTPKPAVYREFFDTPDAHSIQATPVAGIACSLRDQSFIGKVFRVNVHELTPDELDVFMKWRKTEKLTVSNLDRHAKSLNMELPPNVGDVIKSLERKIVELDIEVKHHHHLNDVPNDAVAPPKLGHLTKNKKTLRRLAKDDYHNKFGHFEMAKHTGNNFETRFNQAHTSFVNGVLRKLSRGRPDISIYDKNLQKQVTMEFDTKDSQRALQHAYQQLDANPEADVFLVELTGKDLPKELREVIERNFDAMKSDIYNPKK